jgi:DNA-binding CsgD family transcriptional regulator
MDHVAAVRTATAFIGRAGELARLHELMAGAAAGTSAAVLLAGDAGVGKTSLAAEFGRRARAAGALVLVGRNVDLGTGGLPYLPFAEALAQLIRDGDDEVSGGVSGEVGNEVGGAAAAMRAAREVALGVARRRPSLARLVGRSADRPEGRGLGDADLDRLALFEAISETLSRLAATVAPVVLVVEDLHWAEQSTRDLLRFVLSRLGSDRLLILATYRAEDLHRMHPVRTLLAELLRLPAVELIELAPFGEAELADFLAAVHGARLPAEVVRQIGERSAGNAYFAEELLAAGPGDSALPTVLADVLLDRLERLRPSTQQLVRVASVIGSARIEDRLLRMAAAEGAGLAEPDVDAGLRDALARHILVPEGPDRFGFRHALLQEAGYADLLPGERVRLHAVVARLLAGRAAEPGGGYSRALGADAAEQARHSLAAHDLPQALDASLRAAATARQRLAPGEALVQYDRALELWPVVDAARRPAGADAVTIALDAADAAGDAGLRDRAVALAGAAVASAVATADRDGERLARARLALHLYTADRIADSRTAAGSVIADHDGTAHGGVAHRPTPALVLARSVVARALLSTGDPESALDVVRAALVEARELGLRAVEADLLITLSGADGMLGQPDAEAHLAQARAAAEAAGDQATAMRVAYTVVVDRFEEGDLDAAVRAIREALDAAEHAGLPYSPYATQCRWMLVHARWMGGDPQAALDVVAEGTRRLPAVPARQLQHAALPILAARTPELALAAADELDVSDKNPWNEPVRWAARAEAHAALGDLERSVDCVGLAIDTLDALGEPYQLVGISMSTCAVAVLADLAARARSAGDTRGAEEAVAVAARFIADARERAGRGRPRRFRMGPEGVAWLARLDVEQARLTGNDTAERWRRAVEAFDFGAVYEQARCRWRWAQRLLADGDRDAAREQVTLARDLARRLGAKPLLTALDDLARRGRLDPAPPAIAAGGLLTARERDVMRLVAQGLTNRAIGEQLFISEKTASVHVSNVLTKLSASGRAEAVAIATRDGLLDD